MSAPRSVRNALQVAKLLRARGPMGVSAVAAEIGVAPSTAHRLLSALTAEGFVRRSAQGRTYEVGPVMLLVAGSSPIEHCVAVAADVVRALSEETGETVHLSALRGADVVFVASAEAGWPARVASRVGQHPPAHATAAGKILLATLEPDAIAELYPDPMMSPVTPASLTLRDVLAAELARAREDGYARNLGESEPDMYALAVPVERPSGPVVCSLSIALPMSRAGDVGAAALTPREREHLALLRGASAGISAALAY